MSDTVNVLNSLIEKANEVIESGAKLSTKKRKALKKGSFCGPDRSLKF